MVYTLSIVCITTSQSIQKFDSKNYVFLFRELTTFISTGQQNDYKSILFVTENINECSTLRFFLSTNFDQGKYYFRMIETPSLAPFSKVTDIVIWSTKTNSRSKVDGGNTVLANNILDIDSQKYPRIFSIVSRDFSF